MQDIILKNGRIYDGSGSKEAYTADIAIKDGLISKIGENLNDEAKEIIDLEGLAVSPGFIDVHSHSDTSFLWNERCESKVTQGVTSELAGQCGSTIYPCPKDRMENIKNYAKNSLFDSDYYASSSYEEFMEKAKEQNKKMGTNLVSLIGHGALRVGVLGQEPRKATKEEIAEMCRLLDEDMKNGAWGLSLGLGYSPGLNADIEELIELGKVVQKYDGVITSHMRDQGDYIYEALEEMYEINRKSGAKVHIAHLKLSGKRTWGTADKLMENINKAKADGIKVTADMYPYIAASSGITNSFPKWSIEGGTEKAAERLQGPERERIMAFLEENFNTKEDAEGLYIVTTFGSYSQADGKNIWQLSQELGLSIPETIAKATIETNSYATCISFAMSDEDVMYLLGQENIGIGSDGSGMPLDPAENKGKPHPRNFGTFPRFLRLARENNLGTLESRIHRMTKMNADIIGLKDRGLLEEGYVADITVFNPDTVTDTNSFEDPFSKCEGIEYVLMNGRFALKNGRQTEELLGGFIIKEN